MTNMQNSKTISDIFKVISLLIIDIVTIKIAFSKLVFLNIWMFPLAISFIFLSLIILNFSIALSNKIIKLFGMSIFITVISSSVIYYLFTMIFTIITYISISTKWYFISMMLVTLFFVLINSGLIFIRNNKTNTKEYMSEIKLIMMNTTDVLRSKKNLMDADEYNNLKKLIDKAFERISSCTPFGINTTTSVIYKEHEVINKLKEANTLFEDNEIDLKKVAELFDDIYHMVCDREKLLIK